MTGAATKPAPVEIGHLPLTMLATLLPLFALALLARSVDLFLV